MPQLHSHQRNPLGRTVRLLGWMADHDADDFGVRELAAAVTMAPSTVHRSLGALEEEGLVESDTTSGRYRLSLGFYRLALRGSSRAPLLSLALPYLRELGRESGETALLALFAPSELATMYAAEVATNHPLQVRPPLYRWHPLHASAAGLAVLAAVDRQTQDAALRELPAELAERTRAELALALVHRCVAWRGPDGYLEVAVAFQGVGRITEGALSVVVPEQRADDSVRHRLEEMVARHGQQISGVMAGSFA